MPTARVQIVLRLPESLYARVKRQARREEKSVNSFIEDTLERAVELEFPKIPKSDKISDELMQFCGIIPPFTQEQLDADPRLKYILEK